MDSAIQDAKNKAQAEVLAIIEAAFADEECTDAGRRQLRNVAILAVDSGFMAGVDFTCQSINALNHREIRS